MNDIKKTVDSIYEVPITAMDGSQCNLEPYRGNVLLIVNVASRCGFTPQYKALEQMYREKKDRGFAILGFPCNQFLHQEPGTHQDIQHFVTDCFQITFPLFAKIDVKGKNQAPLYHYLQKHMKQKPLLFIPWNFTKILVDSKGNVLKQYLPITPITKIRNAIEKLGC